MPKIDTEHEQTRQPTTAESTSAAGGARPNRKARRAAKKQAAQKRGQRRTGTDPGEARTDHAEPAAPVLKRRFNAASRFRG